MLIFRPFLFSSRILETLLRILIPKRIIPRGMARARRKGAKLALLALTPFHVRPSSLPAKEEDIKSM